MISKSNIKTLVLCAKTSLAMSWYWNCFLKKGQPNIKNPIWTNQETMLCKSQTNVLFYHIFLKGREHFFWDRLTLYL